ncbi:hypothetical protein MRB53_006170 [Persea americana]|uniref:Uncharacterized protein n=1 Tax=Persea americana TaxID=3435 RepID=A0ACC2MFD4_PERAE|nr:hypothetical protein MRB53_006170 [Persea americana]
MRESKISVFFADSLSVPTDSLLCYWFLLYIYTWKPKPAQQRETVGARVWISVPGGLLELFVAKKKPSLFFIISPSNTSLTSPSWEQEAMLAGNGSADTGLDGPCLNNGFTGDNPIDHQLEPFPSNGYETKSNTNHFQPWVPSANDNSSLPWGSLRRPNPCLQFIPEFLWWEVSTTY